MFQNSIPQTILDAKGETGFGKPAFTEGFNVIKFYLATDGGGDANLTVKFQSSDAENAPDFSAAQSVTNEWDYIEIIDTEDGSTVDGDDGIAASNADVYRKFQANIDAARWVNAQVSARSAGEVTVTCRMFKT